jgi:hypothetical protein
VQELRAAAQEGAAAASSGGTGSVDWATIKGVVQHAKQQRGDGAVPSMQQVGAGLPDWLAALTAVLLGTPPCRQPTHWGAAAVPACLQLCRGSGIVFPKPRKPQGKPPELQRRLDELKARLEQQQYDRMVQDVTQVGAGACWWVLVGRACRRLIAAGTMGVMPLPTTSGWRLLLTFQNIQCTGLPVRAVWSSVYRPCFSNMPPPLQHLGPHTHCGSMLPSA